MADGYEPHDNVKVIQRDDGRSPLVIACDSAASVQLNEALVLCVFIVFNESDSLKDGRVEAKLWHIGTKASFYFKWNIFVCCRHQDTRPSDATNGSFFAHPGRLPILRATQRLFCACNIWWSKQREKLQCITGESVSGLLLMPFTNVCVEKKSLKWIFTYVRNKSLKYGMVIFLPSPLIHSVLLRLSLLWTGIKLIFQPNP